ncbi:M24 family metallopeptidase [Sulfuracidifex tepidarius]|uniref:Xaa-Pro dipeptidase n=1 Tax=Sulfuracidifex tepidarius TaxID=1294262 RepID=A0A510E590_9CREN|nr:Xaa-Pro peptidase family protein [Sulfuracidifex tepidarius]BBG24864.1 Xaa-Pro dipeptidase [Sulfuracidifex tepidarius]BBG27649.1 Xaa-Pro dipeptidase [Sulfuracidifex tepidarius]
MKRSRVDKLRDLMGKKEVDYVILGPTSNMFYLTGFTDEQMERPLLFIVSRDEAYFLAPKLYEEQLSQTGFSVLSYHDGEDPYSLTRMEKRSRVALDDQLWTAFTYQIEKRFSPTLSLASSLLMELRSRKEQEEIDIMMEGITTAESSFLDFLNEVKEGLSECELARKLEEEFSVRGVSPSFPTILTSGYNTSMPHLRCTNRKVKKGDVVIVDFGIKFKGYSTDSTRVVSVGSPNPEVKKVHDVVVRAQEEAESSVSGMKAKDVDRLARSVIEKEGMGNFFIHRTGHGIGIDVHEDPYISKGNEEAVDDNMTFTVEPGVYIPGKFGVRVEDMVLMKGRVRPMNSLSKEIYIV